MAASRLKASRLKVREGKAKRLRAKVDKGKLRKVRTVKVNLRLKRRVRVTKRVNPPLVKANKVGANPVLRRLQPLF